MSSGDLDLMDRITSKEGIRELYVIASQADTQLFGNIKDENDGDLQKVLNQITDIYFLLKLIYYNSTY